MAVTFEWVRDHYDADKSRYIEGNEKDNANDDWKAGTISDLELEKVLVAYNNHILLPGYEHEVSFIIPEGSELSIGAFDDCLEDGKVVCNWSVLEKYLLDHTVSNLWWDLTEAERRSIAETAIKNTLFYELWYGRGGKANCEGGEGDFVGIVCMQNAIIRCLKFGVPIPIVDMTTGYVDACYFKRSLSDPIETCYKQDTYNLPCHLVMCMEHFTGPGWVHAMCAIQVREGFDSLDNWIVFQYSDFDIKPGNWQMPRDKKVKMIALESTYCSGTKDAKLVAEFDI